MKSATTCKIIKYRAALHKQLSSFSLFLVVRLSMGAIEMNRLLASLREPERETDGKRSSVRTHVRLTTNDLCINYMASIKRFRHQVEVQADDDSHALARRFGNPKADIIHVTAVDGH